MEERIVKADPVADPQGYQRELLELLGGRDPVEVLGATPPALREQVGRMPADRLVARPEPAEWSVIELLGHLWDAELAYAFRARLILAQDEPPLVGYDQEAWAQLPRAAFAGQLDSFAALRSANLALIDQVPAADWGRIGVHQERGPTTFRVLTETMAGHDHAHLRQLEQTIATVSRT